MEVFVVQGKTSEMWIPKNFEPGDTFNSRTVNLDRVMSLSSYPPEIHNEILCFAGFKEQIVSVPFNQVLYLLSVGCLVIVTDETSHCAGVSKHYYGIRSMHRPTVVGEEGIEEWARHTALWYTCV